MHPEAVLGTNTSSLRLEALARALSRPQRFVGLHFFSPVPAMELIELGGIANTAEYALQRSEDFCKQIGKTPVRIKASPGYVVNRLLVPYLLHGIETLESGIASADGIDTAMRLGCGHPMGPLALSDLIGLDIDPRTKVHTLGVAQQQMVEIGKALSQNARILVMDEPTAALSDRETERLFAVMRQLQAKGVAIVYISHRMAEVFALGDRITVLRDGKLVGRARPGQTTPDALVRMMVGRTVDMSYPRNFAEKPGEIALEVKGLCARNGIRDIDLTVRAGEIVGLCGLVGSGRSEVARAIFGADEITAGEVRIFGKARRGGPDAAAFAGVGLIPESRKTEGLALIRTVADNLAVAGLPKLFPNGLFSPRRAQRSAEEVIKRLRIATPSPNQSVALLSGGNQQKVVIGKWLAAGTRLFIFDEPTRGIDVGAKSEIFALIDQLVADGAAVLMISSEQAEIVHVCDRAYVMRGKRIVGELSRSELSEENIVRMGMHHD